MPQFIFAAGNDLGQPTLELVQRGIKTETRRALKPNQHIGTLALDNGKRVVAHFSESKKGRGRAMRREGNSYSYTDQYGHKGLGRLHVNKIWQEDVRFISDKSIAAEGWKSKGHYLGTMVQLHMPPLARYCLLHNQKWANSRDPQRVAFAFDELWNDVITLQTWTDKGTFQSFYDYIHSYDVQRWLVAAYSFKKLS